MRSSEKKKKLKERIVCQMDRIEKKNRGCNSLKNLLKKITE
jgi:hypothetical protein